MHGAAGGRLAQAQGGDGGGDEQHRRDGGDRIKGDGRPPGQGVVVNEGVDPSLSSVQA